MRTEILFTNLSIEKMYMYLHMYTCGYMNYIHICVHIHVLFLRGFFIERHVFYSIICMYFYVYFIHVLIQIRIVYLCGMLWTEGSQNIGLAGESV